MIKPLNMPQLSSTKQRTGLQSVADLIPRLIRQYELQAQLVKRREQQAQGIPCNANGKTEQATFAWYE